MDTDIDDSQTGTGHETPIEPDTGASQPWDDFSIQDEDTTTVDVIWADRLKELENRISDIESSLEQDTSSEREVTYGAVGHRPTRRSFLSHRFGQQESEEVTFSLPNATFGPMRSMYNSDSSELEKLGEELYDQPQTIIYAISITLMVSSVYLANPLLTTAAGLMLIVTAIHYAS